MECVEYRLGPPAFGHLRHCLGHGKGLSRRLLRRLADESGSVFTWLPAETPESAAHDFRAGGKLPSPPRAEWIETPTATAVPIPTTREHLAGYVESFLRGSQDRVCVLENALARRSDRATGSFRSELLFFGEEVYHRVPAGAEAATILAALDEAFAIPLFAGVLATAPAETRGRASGAEIGEAELDGLAENCRAVIVGAYDGEGFLVWTPGA